MNHLDVSPPPIRGLTRTRLRRPGRRQRRQYRRRGAFGQAFQCESSRGHDHTSRRRRRRRRGPQDRASHLGQFSTPRRRYRSRCRRLRRRRHWPWWRPCGQGAASRAWPPPANAPHPCHACPPPCARPWGTACAARIRAPARAARIHRMAGCGRRVVGVMIGRRELCTRTNPGQAHLGPNVGVYAALAKPWGGVGHMQRPWAQDWPGQDRCMCIVLCSLRWEHGQSGIDGHCYPLLASRRPCH